MNMKKWIAERLSKGASLFRLVRDGKTVDAWELPKAYADDEGVVDDLASVVIAAVSDAGVKGDHFTLSALTKKDLTARISCVKRKKNDELGLLVTRSAS